MARNVDCKHIQLQSGVQLGCDYAELRSSSRSHLSETTSLTEVLITNLQVLGQFSERVVLSCGAGDLLRNNEIFRSAEGEFLFEEKS
jgi:hypothetical protein